MASTGAWVEAPGTHLQKLPGRLGELPLLLGLAYTSHHRLWSKFCLLLAAARATSARIAEIGGGSGPRTTYPLSCSLMVVRVSQADRGGSLAWRSKLAQASGLTESRAPPPKLAAESTAEEPGWLAGWRAGRTGRGSCVQTGRGRAGLRPHLRTWEPEQPGTVSAFKTEQKKKKKAKNK